MRITAALMVGLLAGSASADVIIGNIEDADSSGTVFGPSGVSTTVYKAAGFTMGAQAFFLDSVEIDISSTNPPGTFDGAIYSDAGGAPGALLISLSAPALGGDGQYAFTPNAQFTLEANTRYWFYLSNNQTAEFLWDASASAPTGAHATSLGYHFNGGSSSFMNKYQVNGTMVPAPASALALGVLGLSATRRRR